jgi:hypothetical protein
MTWRLPVLRCANTCTGPQQGCVACKPGVIYCGTVAAADTWGVLLLFWGASLLIRAATDVECIAFKVLTFGQQLLLHRYEWCADVKTL